MEHLLVNPGFYRSVNMILCLHCVHLIYISTYVFTHVYALISGPVSNLEKSIIVAVQRNTPNESQHD